MMTINFIDADTSKQLHQHLTESSTCSYHDCSKRKQQGLQAMRKELVAKQFQTLEVSRHSKSIRKRQVAVIPTGTYICMCVCLYFHT